MVGNLIDQIDKAYRKDVAERVDLQSSGGRASYKTDIKQFVKEYKDAELFGNQPGRHHSAFPKFTHDESIKDPTKLKARLLKHSTRLDMYKELLPDG